MIGILAAIALVGYRRYLNASKTANAKAVISAIRIAEEGFRAETLTYANCSANLLDFYPLQTAPSGKKVQWRNDAHPDWPCWSQLNVQVDSPTTFRYAVVAGAPGAQPPQPNVAIWNAVWPNPTTEPWFVVQAMGDADNDGQRSVLVSSSFNGEIYVEDESE